MKVSFECFESSDLNSQAWIEAAFYKYFQVKLRLWEFDCIKSASIPDDPFSFSIRKPYVRIH